MEIRKCPNCGSKNISILYENAKDLSYLKEGKFNLLKCKLCDLEFISPLLNEKKLQKYYPPKDYYSFKNKNLVSSIYHNISSYYYSKKRGLLKILIFPFKSLLHRYYLESEKSILEIGCGDGKILKIYKKHGMKTAGIEPYGNNLTEEEESLGIVRNSIEKSNFKEESFDFIILKDAIEHIPKQKMLLAKCRKWLKKGGKLIFTTQNTKSLWKFIFGRYWFGYDVPRHVYNYDKKSIVIFLRNNGFEIKKIRLYDVSYMPIGSMKFWRTDKTNTNKHPLIYNNLTKIIFLPISLIVTWMGLGSLMEVVAEKNN